MSLLLHGDCLEELKGVDDESVDLIFCDLPYGQTSCDWDVKIDINKLWHEFMRIKKLNTPIFFTTTTKFGCDLIQSAPKNCHFRYDLVWVKTAPAGFLCAKKMPMRKHEMVYVFYEKLPFYDLSSHKHKFAKVDQKEEYQTLYNKKETPLTKHPVQGESTGQPRYDPPLPVSVVKEPEHKWVKSNSEMYGNAPTEDSKEFGGHQKRYDPPLPVSVLKEGCYGEIVPNSEAKYGQKCAVQYEPPLPVSVLKEEEKQEGIYGTLPKTGKGTDAHSAQYDPPLPTTMLEIKSTRGKHSTEKPVALMEWILKYYSKEGDVVLDPTMGSGSTGVACKNMNRNFIGIEMNPEIYEVAVNRIDDF